MWPPLFPFVLLCIALIFRSGSEISTMSASRSPFYGEASACTKALPGLAGSVGHRFGRHTPPPLAASGSTVLSCSDVWERLSCSFLAAASASAAAILALLNSDFVLLVFASLRGLTGGVLRCEGDRVLVLASLPLPFPFPFPFGRPLPLPLDPGLGLRYGLHFLPVAGFAFE